MNSSEYLTALAPALAKAQAEARAAFKSGDNKFHRYTYAKYEDIAAACKPVMTDNGLAVLFTADELVPLDDRMVGQNNDKAEHAVRIKVSARLLHASGEWMESSAWGEGQDAADKAPYKAMTGAKKYLLAGLFAIPTTDDPEADETVGGNGGGGAQRHDRAPGSQRSTQVAPQGNGQAPRQQSAPAATRPAVATSAASPASKPSTAPTSTPAGTTEPTSGELRAAKARADEAAEFVKQGLAEKEAAKATASVEDQKRIAAAFKRAEGAVSRDEALECIHVIAGNSVSAPKDVPAGKVAALIDALDRLAGIEVEAP